MDNSDALKMLIKEYRRKKRDAMDDVRKGESQLFDFERKLESLKKYKDECRNGFASIPESALFYSQRRECKLLLDHVDEILHEQHERVSSCLKYIEKNKVLGKKYKERLDQCDQQLEGLLVNASGLDEKNGNMMAGAKKKTEDAYPWIKVGKKI